MTQITALVAILGAGHTGEAIGYRVLNLDGSLYSPFTTNNVVETGIAGTYRVEDGVIAPTSGGTIVIGTVDGDLAEAAIDPSGIGVGTGTGTYTDTVTDGVNPLDGVRVQLSTDALGSNITYESFTDALGVFTMRPDPGVYYRWIDLAGYSGVQGVQVVVP